MRTFETTLDNGFTNRAIAWRRMRAAALALAVVLVATAVARTTHASAARIRPVSKCSDFACEQ